MTNLAGQDIPMDVLLCFLITRNSSFFILDEYTVKPYNSMVVQRADRECKYGE